MLRFRPKKKNNQPTDEPAEETPPAAADAGTDPSTTPDPSAPTEASKDESCAPTPDSPESASQRAAAAAAASDPDTPEVSGPEADQDPELRPIARDEREKLANGISDQVVHSGTGDFHAEDVRARVVDVLMTIFDPEIPVDIYQLGLIYKIDIGEDAAVDLEMTLTSPACPVAGTLPPEVEQKVMTVDGVDQCRVEIVWDPPWNPGMMTESARLELGFF